MNAITYGFGKVRRRTGHPPRAVAVNRAVLADFAVTALIDEAHLTPKPALVDQRGCGAHADLDLPTMLRSAYSLPGWRWPTRIAPPKGSRPAQRRWRVIQTAWHRWQRATARAFACVMGLPAHEER